MNENEANISPVDSIKSFYQIKFEDKGTEIFCFDRVEGLLDNTNRFSNLPVLKEPKLFL